MITLHLSLPTTIRLVCCCWLLSYIFTVQVFAAQQSVAIFQFTATSMDVVGTENDVVYVVRNELRKSNKLTLLNQRDMEVALMRNQIVQSFDLPQALKAGQTLSVNFVVMGSVSRKNGLISAHIALVSTASQETVADWKFNFTNQQEVFNRSGEIGSALLAAIENNVNQISTGTGNSQIANTWLDSLVAQVHESQVQINWKVGPSAAESLGFNIYRSVSADGPFSYLSSTVDPDFVDDSSGLNGEYFYQVSMLTTNGEELRSDKLAKIKISKEAESSLLAPAILSVTQLIKGIEVEFIPSAQNVEKNVTSYQLVRKEQNKSWQVVATIRVDAATESNANKSKEISKYYLRDGKTDTFSGSVVYAIRAVSGEQLGKLSDSYAHTPAIVPNLIDTGVVGLRQSLLTWQAARVGLGYRIHRRTTQSNAEWEVISTIEDLSRTDFVDTNFNSDNQSFEYALTVFDQYSSSSLGEPLTLTSRGPLAAPAEFALQSGQVRKVTLSWQPYHDEALQGYAIYRADYTDSTDVRLLKIAERLDPLANQYVDTSLLQDGSSYYYAVAAINLFDSAGDLTEVLKATSKPAPKPPIAFDIKVSPQHVQLQWQVEPEQNVVKYKLLRRWQAAHWQNLVELDSSHLSYIDSQLMPQALVEYQIVAIDEDGLSSIPLGTEVLRTENTLELISQPDGLLRQINLQWLPVADVEKFAILRRQTGLEWQEVAQISGQHSAYTDTSNLLDDASYDYKIQALYSGELVTESNVISAKTKNIAAPGELQAISGQAQRITLSWAQGADPAIKSSLLYRADKRDNFSAYRLIAEIAADQPSQFIDVAGSGAIEHGQVYRYAVASKNIFDAIGPPGQPIEANSKPVPASASQLSIAVEGQNLRVNWRTGAESDLRRSEIYRRWVHTEVWEKVAETNASVTSYLDDKLLPYATAEYKIKLIDVDQLASGDASTVMMSSPQSILLQASAQGLLRKSHFSWSPNKQVEQYIVERSENNLSWQNMRSLSGNEYLDDEKLFDEKRYYYRVSAYHQGQQLGVSNVIEILTKALPLPPLDISVSQGELKKVKLSWTANMDPDVSGYIVYRLKTDGQLEKLATLKTHENNYVDEGGFFSTLDNGAEYRYILSSFNTYKVEGPKSPVLTAKTKALPQVVRGLESSTQNDAVYLNWQGNPEPDIAQYIIYRGATCGRGSKLLGVEADVTSYIDTTVLSGKDYCYYIVAVDADGLESPSSDAVHISISMKDDVS